MERKRSRSPSADLQVEPVERESKRARLSEADREHLASISKEDLKHLLHDAQTYHEIMESVNDLDPKAQKDVEQKETKSEVNIIDDAGGKIVVIAPKTPIIHPPERKLAMTYIMSLSDQERQKFLKVCRAKIKKTQPPKPRKSRPKKNTPLTDAQKALVGKLFDSQCWMGHRPPSFARVIGWNGTGKRVIIQRIPSTPHEDDGLQGGSCKIDQKWLETHPLGAEMIRESYLPEKDGQPARHYQLGIYKEAKEQEFETIKLPSERNGYYPLDNVNRVFSWCCD